MEDVVIKVIESGDGSEIQVVRSKAGYVYVDIESESGPVTIRFHPDIAIMVGRALKKAGNFAHA